MKTDEAEQNLQVIRTLMERSTIYKRALRPIMWWAGIGAIVSAGAGYFLPGQYFRSQVFIPHWLITGLVILGGAFVLARRQALRDKETFWSPSARRVAQAMLPALLTGLAVTILWFFCDGGAELIVGAWAMLYGCALHAAGFFAPRGLRALGWLFLLFGMCWWLVLGTTSWASELSLYVLMGLIFGGLHLGYAICLTVTRRES
jgi:hypothetical protein